MTQRFIWMATPTNNYTKWQQPNFESKCLNILEDTNGANEDTKVKTEDGKFSSFGAEYYGLKLSHVSWLDCKRKPIWPIKEKLT